VVTTRPFAALPGEIRDAVFRRLHRALTAGEGPAARLPAVDRRAVLDIVAATVASAPPWWQ
jgi:hypothetical protein